MNPQLGDLIKMIKESHKPVEPIDKTGTVGFGIEMGNPFYDMDGIVQTMDQAINKLTQVRSKMKDYEEFPDDSFDIEEYTRATMYDSMLEGMGEPAFIDTFGGSDFDTFNKYIDKAILMNHYKEVGK